MGFTCTILFVIVVKGRQRPIIIIVLLLLRHDALLVEVISFWGDLLLYTAAHSVAAFDAIGGLMKR